MYLNVWLKDRASFFCYFPVAVSEQILPHMNIRKSLHIREYQICVVVLYGLDTNCFVHRKYVVY
jgi:hypothetical protein